MRYVLALVLSAVSLTTFAQTLDDEITQYVVDPCYTQSLKLAGIGELLSVEDGVELMKIIEPENTAKLKNAMKEIVQSDMTFEERMKVYSIGRAMCIQGASQSAQTAN